MRLGRNQLVSGTIAISISAILWGFDGVVLTPRLYNLNVGWVVFVLHVIPFLIMNLFLFREYANLRTFVKQDYILFALVGIFGGALGTISIVKALFLVNFHQLSVVVLLQKLQPIFAIILAAILLKEKIKKNFIIWASIAIIASYFLTFGFSLPFDSLNDNTFMAAMFAILAAFSFGSSTVFSKKILLQHNFITATFFRYGFTSLIMLVYVIITGSLSQFELTTDINWLYFLIIGTTTGSGAIFIYYYGLRRVKAILATISELLFPISAILFDYIFNGSILSPIQIVSAAIMVFAIIKLNS
ncbi:MAG: DMT family transporter [Lentimicrobiaceae bacterium]|jgi:drug/metabolite transporter (DMT)-like permease|nr:DMT family transporter [Lentimicrobiaceae bacterium]MCP4910048.1 DMT family transporter [Bacteroidota bacterium]MBT3453882.1 DMT family transporter [Lentimicrobiaceae bacterium]MBT3819022.1 DMT family transporter [Lentimicrobiaceae bacterium]MBT4061916.1 DMT family transporter [Lentimicrobiaceae bacterium]